MRVCDCSSTLPRKCPECGLEKESGCSCFTKFRQQKSGLVRQSIRKENTTKIEQVNMTAQVHSKNLN
jgi:hypothetical protein